jgi:hypothetical protein
MNTHGSGCTHCACNNPVLKILKDQLFSPEVLAAVRQDTAAAAPAAGRPEPVLFYGGKIRPMIGGDADTVVEAIGFANGVVVAYGSLDDVEAAMQSYSYTKQELAEEQTLLPGLIEPHVHLVPTAMFGTWIDLSRFQGGQRLIDHYDIKWMSDRIKQYLSTADLPDDYWVLATGADPALIVGQDGEQELVTIDNTCMNAMVQDRRFIMLSASMHTLYANDAALKAIFHANPDLQKKYNDPQNYIDATKGQLEEAAGMAPALKALPAGQLWDMAYCGKFIREFIDTAVSRGVTFLYDAGMKEEYQLLFDAFHIAHLGHLKVRFGAAHLCENLKQVGKLPDYQAPATYKDGYYGHAKLVSDGSNQGLTGCQIDPYACDAEYRYGLFNYPAAGHDPRTPWPAAVPQDYINAVNEALITKGWPMMIHANGDQALQYTLEAYGAAIPQQAGNDQRHRIEHCSLLTPESIQKMQDLKLSPSFLIGHVGYWGYAFDGVIFQKDKAQNLDCCASALKAKLRISLHSDCQVTPLGPLRMMEQSITRIMEAAPAGQGNPVLNSAECLTAQQALRAVTYDAAWQCYADQWVGSLDKNHFADFVILAADPVTMSDVYQKMRNIQVVETWKGGTRVYQATAATADLSQDAAPPSRRC